MPGPETLTALPLQTTGRASDTAAQNPPPQTGTQERTGQFRQQKLLLEKKLFSV